MKKIATVSLAVIVTLLGAAVVNAAIKGPQFDEYGYKIKLKEDCTGIKEWKPEVQNFDAASVSGSIYVNEHNAVKGHNIPTVESTKQALFEAAKEGNIERVNYILSFKNYRLDLVDTNDSTLLSVAVRFRGGHPLVVKNIFKKLEKRLERAHNGCKRLEWDAKRFVNFPDSRGRVALWYAVNGNSEVLVKMLLAHDAEVDLDNLPEDVWQQVVKVKGKGKHLEPKLREKYTIVMQAVRVSKDNPKILNLLLAKKPNLLKTTEKGNSALHLAAARGYTKVAQALLNACEDKQACLNLRANDGFTPWMRAMSHGKTETANYLASEGAVITEEDRQLIKG